MPRIEMTRGMFEEFILCTKTSNPSSGKVLVPRELIQFLAENYQGKVAYTSNSNNGVSTSAVEVKVGKITFVYQNSE